MSRSKPKSHPPPGFLEVGTNGKGEVVINHPDLKPDANGVGHIVMSQKQAVALAELLYRKAGEASEEWYEPEKDLPQNRRGRANKDA